MLTRSPKPKKKAQKQKPEVEGTANKVQHAEPQTCNPHLDTSQIYQEFALTLNQELRT
jgi:hypothetical protein